MALLLKLKNRWDEKRHDRRITHHDVVGIAVVSGPLCFFRARRPQFNGEIQDESASGFRVFSERPLQKGMIVKLWVNMYFGDNLTTLKLRGDVAWSATKGTANEAGIQLRAQPERDMETWMHAVAEDMRRADG